MDNMCWCKDCKWYEEYSGVCTNDASINCCDMPDEYNSCEYSERKARNFVEAVKTLNELYEIANKMEHNKASYALAEGIAALENRIRSGGNGM